MNPIFHQAAPGDRIHCAERAIDYTGPGEPAVELRVGDLRLRCTLGQLGRDPRRRRPLPWPSATRGARQDDEGGADP